MEGYMTSWRKFTPRMDGIDKNFLPVPKNQQKGVGRVKGGRREVEGGLRDGGELREG
jgi:hypothetical protein